LNATFGAQLCVVMELSFVWCRSRTLRKVGQNVIREKKMEIIWADLVKNDEHDVAAKENRLHTLQLMKANWIGYMLNRQCYSEQAAYVTTNEG